MFWTRVKRKLIRMRYEFFPAEIALVVLPVFLAVLVKLNELDDFVLIDFIGILVVVFGGAEGLMGSFTIFSASALVIAERNQQLGVSNARPIVNFLVIAFVIFIFALVRGMMRNAFWGYFFWFIISSLLFFVAIFVCFTERYRPATIPR